MKNFITILLFVISCFSYGQTYQTLNKIKVPVGRDMTKKVTIKNCSIYFFEEKKVESKKEYKDSSTQPETSHTVTETKTAPTSINVDKTVEIKLKSFNGVGNIYVDEKDKSKVHINYWLNGSYEVKEGSTVNKYRRTLKCDGTYNEVLEGTEILNKEKKYSYWRCEDTEKDSVYFKNSDVRYDVTESDGTVYYLINKYDRNSDYTIELKNREKISFTNTAVEFGPITIPIKYRFEIGEGTKEVKEQFSTDLNLGIFVGYRFGRYRARYERGVGFKELANISCTVGGFLSASTATLNKSNTNGSDNPITNDDTYSIGLISPGVGVMASIYGFNLGLFLGLDIGVGKEANRWNYDGKPWLGIGLGYSLTSFWKK